jgi:hypothetical protein
MSFQLREMFDIERFEAAEMRHDPCPYFVVPGFVRPDALARANLHYPEIRDPGNFAIGKWPHGPGFQELIDALSNTELRSLFASKFGLDLAENPIQMTVRRLVAHDDGRIHNDSVTKRITGLIYFNDAWHLEGGRLRILRSEHDINDYAVEVPPVAGTLLAFRRNEQSFHGYLPCTGERRALQLHYVDPKRAERKDKRKRGPVAKFFKRLLRATKQAR